MRRKRCAPQWSSSFRSVVSRPAVQTFYRVSNAQNFYEPRSSPRVSRGDIIKNKRKTSRAAAPFIDGRTAAAKAIGFRAAAGGRIAGDVIPSGAVRRPTCSRFRLGRLAGSLGSRKPVTASPVTVSIAGHRTAGAGGDGPIFRRLRSSGRSRARAPKPKPGVASVSFMTADPVPGNDRVAAAPTLRRAHDDLLRACYECRASHRGRQRNAPAAPCHRCRRRTVRAL